MPSEFMALTPRELLFVAEGRALRDERVTYNLAWLMSNLLQPHTKAGVTLKPSDFIARPFRYLKPADPSPAKNAEATADAFLTAGGFLA